MYIKAIRSVEPQIVAFDDDLWASSPLWTDELRLIVSRYGPDASEHSAGSSQNSNQELKKFPDKLFVSSFSHFFSTFDLCFIHCAAGKHNCTQDPTFWLVTPHFREYSGKACPVSLFCFLHQFLWRNNLQQDATLKLIPRFLNQQICSIDLKKSWFQKEILIKVRDVAEPSGTFDWNTQKLLAAVKWFQICFLLEGV